MSEHVYKAIVVTAEVMGADLSAAAARLIAQDLEGYTQEQIATALTRCRREHKGRLTSAAVLERIPTGHPGVEEAWAICPLSERDTVVWTDEISAAYAAAEPLLRAGDQVAARMAFREVYSEQSRVARDERRAPKWWVTFGHDPHQRDRALLRAVEQQRLSAEYADRLLIGTGSRDQLHALAAELAQAKRLGA